MFSGRPGWALSHVHGSANEDFRCVCLYLTADAAKNQFREFNIYPRLNFLYLEDYPTRKRYHRMWTLRVCVFSYFNCRFKFTQLRHDVGPPLKGYNATNNQSRSLLYFMKSLFYVQMLSLERARQQRWGHLREDAVGKAHGSEMFVTRNWAQT